MAASGRETEIKLRVASAAAAEARLGAAGFMRIKARVFEANLLLDTLAGVLRSRGEVLRVRDCGGETILTYKGPASRERHKTREEIETRVGEAGAILTVMARLGFEPTYRYEKYRTEFARPGQPGVATGDETPIGVFMELEGEASWIDGAAADLGFSAFDFILDSYATLFRRYCVENNIPAGLGMTYDEDLSGDLSASTIAAKKNT